ncbi:hypothetical protein [Moraxella bovoculi]|uniref:hypothetical protein n=1 Tax=Moraxella bovoculi TaxID=386891 RepID=UPI00222F2482|nr:hypothetical protein [Moraxella bovoculi]
MAQPPKTAFLNPPWKNSSPTTASQPTRLPAYMTLGKGRGGYTRHGQRHGKQAGQRLG